MASIYISMGNLKTRAEGLAKDAKVYKAEAQAMGSKWAGTAELIMAADKIINACNDAVSLLQKGQKAFDRQSRGN